MNGFKSEMSDYDWEYGIAMVGSCLVAIVAGSQRPLRQPVRPAERDRCWPNLLPEFTIAMMIAFSPPGRKSGSGMRTLLVLVLALGVTGCTARERAHFDSFFDTDLFSDDPDETPLAPMPAQLNPRCNEVASDRANDVVVQGFGADTARAVFNSTYADCVAWSRRGSDMR
jgi:hypothetical protein